MITGKWIWKRQHWWWHSRNSTRGRRKQANQRSSWGKGLPGGQGPEVFPWHASDTWVGRFTMIPKLNNFLIAFIWKINSLKALKMRKLGILQKITPTMHHFVCFFIKFINGLWPPPSFYKVTMWIFWKHFYDFFSIEYDSLISKTDFTSLWRGWKIHFWYASEGLFYANFMLPKPSRIYKIHIINF